MKLRLTAICLLLAALGASAATNATRTVGVIDFQGPPVQAVVDYMAGNLLDKPLIVSPNLVGLIYYRSPRPLTVKEAIAELTSVLRSNGLFLIEVDSTYYRLCQASETNRPPVTARVEVTLENNEIRVDDTPVPATNVVAEIQKRVTPESEIWIYDANKSTNLESMTLLDNLNNAGLGRRVLIAHLPGLDPRTPFNRRHPNGVAEPPRQ